MKKLLLLCLSGLFSILIINGCKHDDGKFISEGSIEYAASVLDMSNSMASMAPSKMLIKFKNNKSIVEMSAGMGLFSTSFVSDPETKTLTQMVKLLNKKFVVYQDSNSIKKENESYKFEIKPTNETKIICGYKCQKAIVHITESEVEAPDFTIYYTKELNIKDPNFSNPFQAIDGVLMEYQLKKFGLEMKFVATKIAKEAVDDKDFEVPTDYKKITPKELDELFQGMM